MSNPMVSVIVTLYNAERHIKKCVDSILAQTLRSFEIILVDNASTDGGFELCRELYGGNDKVKIIRHEKNFSTGIARNTGMKHAAGKYVCFVNGEDFILPSALKKFYTVAEKNNADVVQATGRFELMQDDAEPVRKENLRLKWDNYSREGLLKSRLLYKLEEHWKRGATNLIATLCFCRREFLVERHINFLDIVAADEIFIFALYCLTERYYFIHAPFYIKRNTTDSPADANKKFFDGIRSMIIGSAYIEKFLDKIPHFNNYELWRENLLAAFFYRTFQEYTAPHYKNLLSDANWNALADEAMTPFFPQCKSFVKYFFNGFHAFRMQAAISAREKNEFSAQVTNLFTRLKLSERKIIFVSDNYTRDLKYIAEEILRQNLPCDLIWLMRDANKPLPKKIRKVVYGGVDSIYELATAKIVVIDATESHSFPDKKDGQFFIATLGGQTFTRLAPDVEKNLSTSAAKIDLMISSTREQFDELRDAFNYTGKILTCGLPCNDIFFLRDDKFTAKIRKSLNVPRFSKVVMYAPTIRENSSADVYSFDARKILNVLEEKFGGEWTLLTRLPPKISADILGKSASIIDATFYPDVQELIFVADVLIADYSPIIFDCMLCGKPTFRLAKDFDAYTTAHDFKPLYFALPGKVNRSDAELSDDIKNFDTIAHIQKVNDFMSKLEPFDKGHAAEEIVTIIQNVIDNS